MSDVLANAQRIVNAFSHDRYLLRRKVLSLLGAKFHIYDAAGNVVLFSKMKAFKLKEDVRLYTGEDQKTELLSIRARNLIDFSATYDVFDSATGEKVGALRRKGLKSMLRDTWLILDPQDREIGQILEDSGGLAILRRFVEFAALICPQKFIVSINGQPAANFQQLFNPFIHKMSLDFTPDTNRLLDRRLGLAAAIIILAIEGRQE